MENSFEYASTQNSLVVNQTVKDYLIGTAKWARFLAILGFIGIGIMVIVGLILAQSFTAQVEEVPLLELGSFISIGKTVGIIIYFGIALIYFFPIKYLFDFSKNTKQALQQTDQKLFEDAIFKLKSHYKYIGVMILIIFSFYALVFGILILEGFLTD